MLKMTVGNNNHELGITFDKEGGLVRDDWTDDETVGLIQNLLDDIFKSDDPGAMAVVEIFAGMEKARENGDQGDNEVFYIKLASVAS